MATFALVKRASYAATVAAMLLGAVQPANADPIRVGYWTSGVSLGFGAVLEARKFLQQRGLDVQFVRFADVNAPNRALAANAIDFAFAAPAAAVFSSAAEGVPLRIVLATQPADVEFVAPRDSPIRTLADLRGKRVGMSPAGSSVAAIATAVLQGNDGIRSGDFSLVPGNEARLAQFLVQKQVDAAALRSVTLTQIGELKVKRLGTFGDEWKKLTKSDATPYIGVSVVRADYLAKHRDDVPKLIAGMRDALQWGADHRSDVSAILQRSANLPANDADAYAARWSDINRVTFEPIDIATLKREHQIFVDGSVIEGALPADLFDTSPYTASKSIR
ncbi:ABC transporter substrate-binding protein [Paraburkholderia sp. ZP32-5]|uniref:ABC transporter substrate-binding protein n=1 Tax=Paraburkholderia sp. ZP32-5 TaxID=2883245 RepID=UPI001F3D632D|nr:ABC transporter substrate-binding protein [Paraburkholderia sp. ZP32-5]